MKSFLFTWGLIFLSAFCDSYAGFVVKSKFNELGVMNLHSSKALLTYLIQLLSSPFFLTGIIAFVTAPVLWFLALNRINLSVGYPVLVSFHLFFIVILSIFFLKEALTFKKMLGVLFILLNLYFFFK